jgi:hypothetical protein
MRTRLKLTIAVIAWVSIMGYAGVHFLLKDPTNVGAWTYCGLIIGAIAGVAQQYLAKETTRPSIMSYEIEDESDPESIPL